MASPEIKCPKCGSTQLTANKKGFSGKKAVGGALLTGGIGLLAGTIGSNKIKITCLACGHQFKPGEGLQQNQKIIERTSNGTVLPTFRVFMEFLISKKPGCLIVLIVVIGLLFWGFKSCSDSDKNAPTNVSTSTGTPDNSAPLVDLSALSSFYDIEKEDNDPGNISLMVYISDTSKMRDINQGLVQKYDPNKDQYIQIYYFTKKGIGKTYLNKEMSQNVSEKEKNRLYKYFFAEYKFNPSTGYDALNYMH